MTGAVRLLAVFVVLAGLGLAPAAQAQRSQSLEEILEAIERERQALIELGEYEPPPSMAPEACDRMCLDALGRAYLRSLETGDLSELALGRSTRVTENGVQIAPGEGYWRRAGALRQHRLNILDPDWQVAAGLAVMDNALLAYRLQMAYGALAEIEIFVVEPDDDGATLGRPTLARPHEAFEHRVDPAEQNSRTQLGMIVQAYPDGLRAGSFEAVDAPFAEGAERMENGMILAGPRCTLNENCLDMKTQPSPERPTLRQRMLAIDEEQGVVFMWLDWMQQSGQTLQVYEAFKIYAGHFHGVDAFIAHGDPDIYPGWPIP